MNYKKVYAALIAHAQTRNIPVGYTERHHIVPKALGGDNTVANIVVLTAREHFIAHVLLAKIHGGTMWCAVLRMQKQHELKAVSYTSKLYAIARAQVAQALSLRYTNVPRNAQTIVKISKTQKGKQLSASHLAALKAANSKDAVREKKKVALLGRKYSETRKQAMKDGWARRKWLQQVSALLGTTRAVWHIT